MLFEICHKTRYEYSRPVFIEPHTVRMRPRVDGTQTVERFDVDIDPHPAGMTEFQDAEGNLLTRVWFNDVHRHLSIETRCSVQTTRTNPFDFLPPPHRPGCLADYDPAMDAVLQPALARMSLNGHGDPIRELAASVARKCEFHLVPFLVLLNDDLFHRFRVIHREKGAAWLPHETWDRGSGACRDLAVLLVDACRSVGLAARFVSGYQEGDREQDRREMHAWAEVYVPGAGWRGFDPTHGLAVADRHVAVAAGVVPELASPLSGSFRGDGVTASRETDLTIDTFEPAEVN